MSELFVRRPTFDDLDVVVELGNAFERVFTGAESFRVPELAHEWGRLDLERDAWLVLVPGGRIAGYATLEDRGESRFTADGYVHPDLRGLGVGSKLVELAEERARERDGTVVTTGIITADEAAAELLARRGYAPVRHFYRMQIELGEEAPQPDWKRRNPTGPRAFGPSLSASRTRASSTTRSRTPSGITGITGRARLSSSDSA